MGPRNLIILFFSTLMVSLVILVIFFSLIFKNVDIEFNTKLPNTAPDVDERFKKHEDDLTTLADDDDEEDMGGEETDDTHYMGDGNEKLYGIKTKDGKTITHKPNKRSRILDIEGAVINVPGGEPLGADEESEIAGEEQEALVENPVDPTAEEDADGQRHESFLDPSTSDEDESNPLRPVPYSGNGAPVPPPSNPDPVNHEGVPLPSNPALETTSSNSSSQYQVYIDGFDNAADAQNLANQLKGSGAQPYVKTIGGQSVVQIGIFSSKENADSTAKRVGAKVRKIR